MVVGTTGWSDRLVPATSNMITGRRRFSTPNSGYGRGSGPDGILEMTQVKSVQILLSDQV